MSSAFTGYRYRLEPTATQQRLLSRSAGACRWLWNWALGQRKAVYEASEGRVKVDYVDQANQLPPLKGFYPFLVEAPSHALQQTLRDLDRAYVDFFEGRAAFPRFRARGTDDSFRFPDPKQFQLEGDWLRLPKLGWVRLRLSRKVCGRIRNVTVCREGRHWFAALCCEGDYRTTNAGGAALGLDAGVAQDLTDSTGQVLDLGAPTRREWRFLARLQRRVSRRVLGSRRWRRAQERAARLRRHLAGRRRDRAHKESTRLAKAHALVVIEDLALKPMTASAKGTAENPGRNVQAKAGFNREMLSRGHADFRRMLAYKCERSGARLLAVPAAHTSQTCSQCGHCAPENRKSQAVFRCLACGHTLNADHNAALNILAAGLAATARGERHDPASSSSGQLREARIHPRDPSGLAGNPGQGRCAA